MPTYLSLLTELRRLQTSGGGGSTWTPTPPVGSLLQATLQAYWLLLEVHFPPTEGSNTGGHRNTKWPLIWIAAKGSMSSITPASHRATILHGVVPRTRPRAGLGTHGVRSVLDSQLHSTTPPAGDLNTPAYVNKFRPFGTHR